MSMKRRCAILTWNNYPADYLAQLESGVSSGHYSYVVGQCEVGKESKTPHVQAALYKRNGLAFKKICKALKGAVLKSYNDDASSMLEYVTKEDTRVMGSGFDFGVRPEIKGCNGAAKKLGAAIVSGEIKTVKEAMVSHPERYLSVSRGVKRMLEVMNPPDKTYRKPDVQVLWGPTGTGKTRLAIEGAKHHNVDYFKKDPNMGQWWDHYDSEPYIIIDDFRGSHMPLSHLLVLLDGYGSYVQVKGGSRWVKPLYWVITSCQSPDTWYDYKEDAYDQLARRITNITHVSESAYAP